MNNNKQDLAALSATCKGVFSPSGFLNVGEGVQYEDPSRNVRDSYKGKQFQVMATKTGKTLDTYFGLNEDKKHLYVSEGLVYQDTLRFAEAQPNKPGKGFLTSDYCKRGEFTDTIRTEQYRAQLRQEEKIAKKQRARTAQAVIVEPVKLQPKDPGFLFDRVFASSRPGKDAQKLPRDTSNPTMLSKERQVGEYNTTYLLTHTASKETCKPEFARRAVVRDTFYDKDMNSARV